MMWLPPSYIQRCVLLLLWLCCGLLSTAQQAGGNQAAVLAPPLRPLIIFFTECAYFGTGFFWNGKTYREVHGLSGALASSIFLAEGLAKRGHVVYFLSNNIVYSIHNQVTYANLATIEGIACDVFVSTDNMKDLELWGRIKITAMKHIVILNETPKNVPCNFHTYNRKKVTFAHVSTFGILNIIADNPWLQRYENVVMHSSINIAELPTLKIATFGAISPYTGEMYATSIDSTQKRDHFVFFALFERGAKLSFEVAKHFPEFKFLRMSYLIEGEDYREKLGDDPHDQIVLVHSNRNEIMRQLLHAKYFVYPLVHHESSQIHYDTFGYVVLEALLHGVIVVAPRMACYEELYGDAIAYVEVSDLISQEFMNRWNSSDAISDRDIFVSRHVAKIEELEKDPALAQSYIEKGLKLAQKFDNVRVALDFEIYLFPQLEALKLARDEIDAIVNKEYSFPQDDGLSGELLF